MLSIIARLAGRCALALWGAGVPTAVAVHAAPAHRLPPDTAVAPLVRFPQVHRQQVVFVARGNLWVAPRQGGAARRLTRHEGQDAAPRYSPDGRWLAFSSTWHGSQQVYVLPARGGRPRQLTFRASGQPVDNLVLSWTPDSRFVVFASQQQNLDRSRTNCRPYQVPVGGGLATPLPLGATGLLSFGPRPTQLVYASALREFEARKRYNGGQAPDLYTYDLRTHQRTRLTDWVGTDTAPMWVGNRIYFLSDRDSLRRLNLWVYDLATRQTRAVTHFRDFDIDFPAFGDGVISFQQGGRLYLLDLPSEHLRAVPVRVPDDGSRTAPRRLDAAPTLRPTDYDAHAAYSVAPAGEQWFVAARGDLFALATATGQARNLTQTSTADEEYPACSPDGQHLAYVTDASGEQQLAVRPVAGGPARQLTAFAGGYFYQPTWSPDGQWLALADGEHRLWLVPAEAGRPVQQVAQDPYAEIHDLCFSPDGRWLVFGQQRPNQQRGLFAYELATARTIALSSPLNSDAHPAFAADGRQLYFASNRHELPVLSASENNFATIRADGLYAVPWPAGAAPAEQLLARARALPVSPATITGLEARPGGWLFYQTQPSPLIGGALPGEAPSWRAFSTRDQHDQLLAAGPAHGVLTADGRYLLYGDQQGAWHLAATPLLPAGTATRALSLPELPVRSVPRQEWATMFEYAWRLERDLYYSPTLTGNDWAGLRARYARLLPQLGARADLTYLLQQLLGELASSHLYIRPGPAPGPPPLALLGADYALDAKSGRYRLAALYPGDPARPRYRSPLAELAEPVREGDYLLAINGRELRAPLTPDSLLTGASGPLRLRVAPAPTGPSREVVVQPLASEWAVREQAWIDRTRARVAQLSQGRVGYVYLSNFDELGAEQFVRQYYPQLDKEALLFDVRWNTGGFTSQLLLERLRRPPVAGFLNRQQAVETLPGQVPPPVLATLTNQFTNSDGDQFPYFFRLFGLGPVLGSRTEGGVRGIQQAWPLLDGATVTAPKDALFRADGQWIIENTGTAPDVELDEAPVGVGEADAQLAAAVQALLGRLPAEPPVRLRRPAAQPAYPPGGQVAPAH